MWVHLHMRWVKRKISLWLLSKPLSRFGIGQERGTSCTLYLLSVVVLLSYNIHNIVYSIFLKKFEKLPIEFAWGFIILFYLFSSLGGGFSGVWWFSALIPNRKNFNDVAQTIYFSYSPAWISSQRLQASLQPYRISAKVCELKRCTLLFPNSDMRRRSCPNVK